MNLKKCHFLPLIFIKFSIVFIFYCTSFPISIIYNLPTMTTPPWPHHHAPIHYIPLYLHHAHTFTRYSFTSIPHHNTSSTPIQNIKIVYVKYTHFHSIHNITYVPRSTFIPKIKIPFLKL